VEVFDPHSIGKLNKPAPIRGAGCQLGEKAWRKGGKASLTTGTACDKPDYEISANVDATATNV
jgi:hypothetical protein